MGAILGSGGPHPVLDPPSQCPQIWGQGIPEEVLQERDRLLRRLLEGLGVGLSVWGRHPGLGTRVLRVAALDVSPVVRLQWRMESEVGPGPHLHGGTHLLVPSSTGTLCPRCSLSQNLPPGLHVACSLPSCGSRPQRGLWWPPAGPPHVLQPLEPQPCHHSPGVLS